MSRVARKSASVGVTNVISTVVVSTAVTPSFSVAVCALAAPASTVAAAAAMIRCFMMTSGCFMPPVKAASAESFRCRRRPEITIARRPAHVDKTRGPHGWVRRAVGLRSQARPRKEGESGGTLV